MKIIDNKNIRFDSLLNTLVLFTRLYHKPYSADSLIHGLPIEPGNETPELFTLNKSKGLFSRAANRAGLKSSLTKKHIKNISKLQLPMILILNKQDSCILNSFNKDETKAKIYMSSDDPVEQWVDIDELEKNYSGYGFLINKFFEYSEENKRTIHLDKKHWFWSTILLSKSVYKDVIIVSLLINLFVLATPLFTMNVYDRVIPNNSFETLYMFSIGVMLVYILDAFFKYIRVKLLEQSAQKSDIIMSSIIFEKVLDLKMKNQPKSVGSFASNLKDFDSIRSFLTNFTLASFVDIPFAILFLFVIGYVGGNMVYIPIFTIVSIIIYSYFIRKPLRKSIESTHEAHAKKNAILIEALNNIETLKSINSLGTVQYKWEESTGEIAKKSYSSRLISSSIPIITQLLIQLNTVVVVIFGVYKISELELSMGGLIAIIILTGRTLSPMGQISSLITSYEDMKTSYDRINDIIGEEGERPEAKKFVKQFDFTGDIEFKDVTFSYPGTNIQVIKNVSFKIKNGDKVAFIGKIGSGKTTIQKLIMGLYEPDSGSILINGIDIKQIDPAELRNNISYVSQDINLFNGTAKENIAYRASYADDDTIMLAAKISGADEFIKNHPRGYDMPIYERGMGLSGGQKQSIGIARALLVNSPIVLMDEPSNAMDQTTEKDLFDSFKNNLSDKTVIYITQKMALLDIVDRVIVINDGKLFADGNKQEVIKALKGEKQNEK